MRSGGVAATSIREIPTNHTEAKNHDHEASSTDCRICICFSPTGKKIHSVELLIFWQLPIVAARASSNIIPIIFSNRKPNHVAGLSNQGYFGTRYYRCRLHLDGTYIKQNDTDGLCRSARQTILSAEAAASYYDCYQHENGKLFCE